MKSHKTRLKLIIEIILIISIAFLLLFHLQNFSITAILWANALFLMFVLTPSTIDIIFDLKNNAENKEIENVEEENIYSDTKPHSK